MRRLGYAIFKHGGIRVRVLEALGGLRFAFLNHGGIRVEVLKHVWMSLGSSGLFAAIKIQENLKLDRPPKPLPERLIFVAPSHFLVWTEYLVFAAIRIQQNLKLDRLPKPLPERLIFIARAIFQSGPNIWFLKSLEGRFNSFLGPGPKPLSERFIFIAREPFFGLNGISGFWNLQKAV